MAVRVIKVPDVGEGIAEVELVAWYVQPGDSVVEDQRLADVMTDKASVEIPSSLAGRVVALGGEVGQMLAVGSELIRIEVGEAPVAAEPRATVAAPAAPMPAAAPRAERSERPIASPAVRRRAWELGVDLAKVMPTGTAGRIVHADLDAAGRGGMPAAAPRVVPAATEVPRDETETIKVVGLRRRIAMQMQEAKRRIPHFAYVEELDITEVEALRATLNERHGAARGRLTLLPFLMRAMVLSVREFPQINARFDDETGVVTRHRAVHLGIATQTPNGLVVPVVRHAEALDLWAMTAEVARLAQGARAGRATRDELTGSTITLSSLGALGGIASTPIINRPEVAIVGVNRIVEKPVVRGGAVVVRKTMNLSSSFDHRVVDGADAAAFIQAVRARLEQPALLFAEPGA
jgi:2-oxoisovalerate dehydrogenase E2 component (dihydrolipoyl transacylase)